MNLLFGKKKTPVQISANVSLNTFTDFIMRRRKSHNQLQRLVRDVFTVKPKKDHMIEMWSNYPQNFGYYDYFEQDHRYQLAEELGMLNTSTAITTKVVIDLQNVLAESLVEFAFDGSNVDAKEMDRYKAKLYLDQDRREEVWKNEKNTVLIAKHYDTGKTSVIIFIFLQDKLDFLTFSATVHHDTEAMSFEIYQVPNGDDHINFWKGLVSQVKVRALADEIELNKQEEAEAQMWERLNKLAEENLARKRAHELKEPERRLDPSAPPVNNGDNVQDPDLMVTAPGLPPKPPPRPVHPAPAVYPPPPGPPVRPPAGVEPENQVTRLLPLQLPDVRHVDQPHSPAVYPPPPPPPGPPVRPPAGVEPENQVTRLLPLQLPDVRHVDQPHSPAEHDNSRPFLWEWHARIAELEELWRVMVLPVLKKPAHEKELLMRHLLPLVGRELFGLKCDYVLGIETKNYYDDGLSTPSHHHVMGNTDLGKVFIVYRRDNRVRFLYQGPSHQNPLNASFVMHNLEFYLEMFFMNSDTSSASDTTDGDDLQIGQYPRAIEVPVAEAVVPGKQNNRERRRARFNDGEQSTVPYDPPPRNNPVESQPLASFDDRAQSPIPHDPRSQWEKDFDRAHFFRPDPPAWQQKRVNLY